MIPVERLRSSFPRAVELIEPHFGMLRKAFTFACIGLINVTIDYVLFLLGYWYLSGTPTALRLLEKHVPGPMRTVADALGAKPGQSAADVVEALNARVGLPSNLRELGYKDGDLDDMAADAAKSHFLGRSPYRPSVAEFKTMIRTVVG